MPELYIAAHALRNCRKHAGSQYDYAAQHYARHSTYVCHHCGGYARKLCPLRHADEHERRAAHICRISCGGGSKQTAIRLAFKYFYRTHCGERKCRRGAAYCNYAAHRADDCAHERGVAQNALGIEY